MGNQLEKLALRCIQQSCFSRFQSELFDALFAAVGSQQIASIQTLHSRKFQSEEIFQEAPHQVAFNRNHQIVVPISLSFYSASIPSSWVILSSISTAPRSIRRLKSTWKIANKKSSKSHHLWNMWINIETSQRIEGSREEQKGHGGRIPNVNIPLKWTIEWTFLSFRSFKSFPK